LSVAFDVVLKFRQEKWRGAFCGPRHSFFFSISRISNQEGKCNMVSNDIFPAESATCVKNLAFTP
jgi:hypothetical protein